MLSDKVKNHEATISQLKNELNTWKKQSGEEKSELSL